MPKRPVHETWPELDDDALLDVRMADLPLVIEGTLARRIELLREELRARDLRAKNACDQTDTRVPTRPHRGCSCRAPGSDME